MKRILIVNYEFPPLGGGGAKASFYLAKHLSESGMEVEVLTSSFKNYKILSPSEKVRIHKVRSWRKGIHNCGILGAFSFVWFGRTKIMRLLQNQEYDVIHYFFSLPSGALSLFHKKISAVEYVISLRGSDVPGYDPYNKKIQFLHKLLKPLHRKILHDARTITAVTESLKVKALESFPTLKIDVIPNGVEKKFLSQKRVKLPSEGLKLITVSRLIERKGISHILNAIALIKGNISLTIVGAGEDRAKLEKLVEKKAIQHRVKFLGYRSGNLIPELLSHSDVFILCSEAEAFGNVFAEAMSVGLPIIGSNVGGITDLVGKENGILVNPGDVEAIKSAIEFFLDFPGEIEKMGKVNRQWIRENYQWKEIVGRYKNIYAK